jgi:hypothetical protein
MNNKLFYRKTAFVFLLLYPSLLRSQQSVTSIPIPMKNGIVFYEKNYDLPVAGNEKKSADKAISWIKETFPGTMVNNSTEGLVRLMNSTGSFKIPVGPSGNFYWVRMKISVGFHESFYTVGLYDYYEKPIEKGVSNEYSKIEYRWWDYKRGKPWSAEDSALFAGIHQWTLDFLDGLEAAIK